MDFSVEIGRRPEVAYTIHPSSRALLTAVRVKRWRAYKGPPIPIRYSRGFFCPVASFVLSSSDVLS